MYVDILPQFPGELPDPNSDEYSVMNKNPAHGASGTTL
jgi:hypothetical protein